MSDQAVADAIAARILADDFGQHPVWAIQVTSKRMNQPAETHWWRRYGKVWTGTEAEAWAQYRVLMRGVRPGRPGPRYSVGALPRRLAERLRADAE